MSGVTFTVEFDDREAMAAFGRLAGALRDKRPLLRAIGVGLASNTRARFNEGRGPGDVAWAPLNPAYAAIKRGTHILVGSGMSGGLQGSISFATGSDTVSVGTNKVYGAIHQFGGTIRPKNAKALRFRLAGGFVFVKQVRIPARPYLGFDDRDQVTVTEAVEDVLDAAIRGGASP